MDNIICEYSVIYPIASWFIMNVYQFIHHLKHALQKAQSTYETPNVVSSGIPQSTYETPNVVSQGIAQSTYETPNVVSQGIVHMSFPSKYTYLTDIKTDSGVEPCACNNSLLSMNLESNLGVEDHRTKDAGIHVSICLFRKNQHTVMTDILTPNIETEEEETDRKEHPVVLEYLSYYMELDTPEHHEKRFAFPSFTYHLDDYRVNQEEDDEDVDPFKEACIEHLLKLFSMEQKPYRNKHHTKSHKKDKHHKQPPTKPTSVDFGYHGMIRHEDTVYAFFDMNAIEQSFRISPTHYETHPCLWAVVDEIVRKKTIFHIPVATEITELFMKNPMLWNISHGGVSLLFPRAMYSVVPSIVDDRHIHADDIDDLYENVDRPDYKTAVYSSSPSSSTKKSKLPAPILPFAYSDMFAERYLFTDKPIPVSSHTAHHFKNGLPKYKRFVVFMYNPKFIFSQKFKSHRKWIDQYPQNFVENMDPEDDDAMEENRHIPCICFSQKLKHHKPVEIWGVIHDDLFDEISMK